RLIVNQILLHQRVLGCPDCDLCTRTEAELGEQVLDMGGHGPVGHDELGGNLAVSVTTRNQRRDLLLAWTQRVDSQLPPADSQVRGRLQRLSDGLLDRQAPPACQSRVSRSTQGAPRWLDLLVQALLRRRVRQRFGLFSQGGGRASKAECARR